MKCTMNLFLLIAGFLLTSGLAIAQPQVEQYKDFGGTRNEEDILITETGYKILGKPLAKTIDDVEKQRSYAFNQ